MTNCTATRAPARPVGERRRAAVADHVARIGFAVRHPVFPRSRSNRRPGQRYDRTGVCSSLHERDRRRRKPVPQDGNALERRLEVWSSGHDDVDQLETFLPRRVGETLVERDHFERRGTALGGKESRRELQRTGRP